MNSKDINFEQMGIYDLRNYARSIGVISPTKFKRDELITKITAIIEGDKPEQKKTNKGRPPKHKIDEDYNLAYILPNNLFENNINDNRYKQYEPYNIKLGYGDMLSASNKPATTNIYFEGYLKMVNEMYSFVLRKGFLSNYHKENVVILSKLIEEYNLKNGDYVSGSCRYVESKNVMLATEVLEINNAKASADRQESNLKAKYPTHKIALSNNDVYIDYKIIDKICPIAKGSRAIINYDANEVINCYCRDILNEISITNNIKTTLISIDDIPEEIAELEEQCENINVKEYNPTIERDQFLDSVDMIIENCCRRLENGEDVALVFYNLENFKNNIQSNAVLTKNMSTEEAKLYSINYIKDILSLSRNYDRGSFTILAFNILDKEICDYANCYIKLNKFSYEDTDVLIDVINSNTKNVNKIITEEDYKKLIYFKKHINLNNVLEQLNKLFN